MNQLSFTYIDEKEIRPFVIEELRSIRCYAFGFRISENDWNRRRHLISGIAKDRCP